MKKTIECRFYLREGLRTLCVTRYHVALDEYDAQCIETCDFLTIPGAEVRDRINSPATARALPGTINPASLPACRCPVVPSYDRDCPRHGVNSLATN